MDREVRVPSNPAFERGTIPGFEAFDLDRLATHLPGGRATLLGRFVRRTHYLVRGLILHNGFQAAPAMAFHFFLSLIPLLVLAGTLLGRVVKQGGADELVAPILGAIPREAGELLRRELDGMAAGETTAAPLSILGFLVLASNGAHNLMDVFEVAASARRRPWWKKRAISLAFVFSIMGATAVVAWGFVRAETFVAALASPGGILRRVVEGLGWQSAPAIALLAIGGTVTLAAFYRYGVARHAYVKRRVWPGALLAFVLLIAFSSGFALYVSRLGRYAAYYGSLAAVSILLLWLYASSLALLLGAELNAQLEGVHVGGSMRPDADPEPAIEATSPVLVPTAPRAPRDL